MGNMKNDRFTDYFNFDDIINNCFLSVENKKNNYFLDYDSEEFFKKNLVTQPEDWHYRTKEIAYNVNSYGYRTKEFNEIDWSESIVIFGCSNVFGIGLSEDETISYNISKLTGRYVVNLGFPGGSNYISYYNSLMIKKKYGIPYSVIFIWTNGDRYTYFTKEKLIHLGTWNYEIYTKINDKNKYTDEHKKWSIFYETLIGDSSHNIISNYFLLESIREFWKGKTKYSEGSFFDEYKNPHFSVPFIFNEHDYEHARDLGHPGRDINKIAAKIITEDLK